MVLYPDYNYWSCCFYYLYVLYLYFIILPVTESSDQYNTTIVNISRPGGATPSQTVYVSKSSLRAGVVSAIVGS